MLECVRMCMLECVQGCESTSVCVYGLVWTEDNPVWFLTLTLFEAGSCLLLRTLGSPCCCRAERIEPSLSLFCASAHRAISPIPRTSLFVIPQNLSFPSGKQEH